MKCSRVQIFAIKVPKTTTYNKVRNFLHSGQYLKIRRLLRSNLGSEISSKMGPFELESMYERRIIRRTRRFSQVKVP